MSLQLILFPQYFNGFTPLATTGNEFYTDGTQFTTFNNSGSNASITSIDNFINNSTINVNSFRRFGFTAALPTESGGAVTLATESGFAQRLSSLQIGTNYTCFIDVAVNLSGLEFRHYSNNVLVTSGLIGTGLTGTLTLPFIAQSTNDIIVISTDGVLVAGINSVSVQQDNYTPSGAIQNLSSGEVLLDLYEEEAIPLTLSVDDFKNVAEKVQSYSKAFNLPASKRNNKIFDNIFDITRSTSGFSFNPYVKTKSILKQDGLVIFEGYLRLIDINDKDGEISYNVNLYSEAIALADLLKDRTFNDIDLAELTHTYNYTNIENSWNSGTGLQLATTLSTDSFAYDSTLGTGNTNVLKYPFVNWIGSINLSDGTNGTSGMPELTRLEEVFRPFIQIKYLINRIFEATPFSYTSEFFNTIGFESLFMDFNWGSDNNPAPAGVDDLYYGAFSFDPVNPTASPPAVPIGTSYTNIPVLPAAGTWTIWTPPNYDTTTGVLTATVTGESYNVDYNLGFLVTNSSAQTVTVEWLLNTTAINQQTYNAQGLLNNNYTYQGNFDVYMTAGDTLTVRAKSTISSGVTCYYAEIYWDSSVSIVASNSILQTLRGELKQWDFLSGIMTMFNLIAIPDKNNPNNIIIEPYKDVFVKNTNSQNINDLSLDSRSIPQDWTDKIDVQDIKLAPLTDLNKTTIFQFEEDGDDFAFNHYKNAAGGFLYGSKVYDASALTVLDGEEKIEANPFAATIVKPLHNDFDLVIPVIYGGNEEEGYEAIDNLPRILFNNGLVTMPTTTYYVPEQNGVAEVSAENQYLQFSHFSALPIVTSQPPATTDTQDFHFGECQLVGLGNPTSMNLFNMYWLPYLSELYNPDTRTMTLKINLNAADINTFNFNDKIYIKQRVFRVNKIDYKPYELSTIELILIP
jgi:hypothetical protein